MKLQGNEKIESRFAWWNWHQEYNDLGDIDI